MTDSRLARIEDKLDKVADHISSIDSTLAAQHVSLSEHMRRTAILEESIKPLQKHVLMTHGVLKFIGLLATIGAIVEGAIIALEYFKR